MSLTIFTPARTSARPNRRQHQRYEPRELTYVDLGPDNGGLLLNISEGGLGFEGILGLADGQMVPVEFKLPGTSITIRATCQFARKDDPGRGGGLRFVDLTEEARQQIKEWIAATAGRQEDPSQGVENRAASEAAAASNPKAKNEIIDSPIAVREQRTTLLSPEPNPSPVPIAPILAPATPRADSTSATPNARAAVGNSFPLQAAPQITAAEPKPPLRAAPSGSDATRSQKSRAALSLQQPTSQPALTYKAKPAATQKKARDSARGPSNFGAQVLQFVAGVAAGCLAMVVIAGALLWSGYFQLPSAVASRTSTGQSATGPSNQDFELEIVNLNNQRWTLPMAPENNPEPSEPVAPAPPAQAPNSAAALPHATEPTAKASVTRSTSSASPQLALPRPRAAGGTPGSASLQAPSLFEGITPPLPSPLPYFVSPAGVPVAPATALPSPEPAAAPPPLTAVLPSAPQPETGSPSAAKTLPTLTPEGAKPVRPTSFRPAELTRRFDPIYPVQARQQQAQGRVQVSATIGKDGLPRELKFVGGDSMFSDAAIAAIARWRYKPATLDGQPVDSQLTITINFQL